MRERMHPLYRGLSLVVYEPAQPLVYLDALGPYYGNSDVFKSKAGHALWENVKLKLPILGRYFKIGHSPLRAYTCNGRRRHTDSSGAANRRPDIGQRLISAAVSEAIVRIEEGSNIPPRSRTADCFR